MPLSAVPAAKPGRHMPLPGSSTRPRRPVRFSLSRRYPLLPPNHARRPPTTPELRRAPIAAGVNARIHSRKRAYGKYGSIVRYHCAHPGDATCARRDRKIRATVSCCARITACGSTATLRRNRDQPAAAGSTSFSRWDIDREDGAVRQPSCRSIRIRSSAFRDGRPGSGRPPRRPGRKYVQARPACRPKCAVRPRRRSVRAARHGWCRRSAR